MEIRGFLLSRGRDVQAAFTTLPSGRIWFRCFGVGGVFAGLALPLGLGTDFLEPRLPQLRPAGIAKTVLKLLAAPALIEEIVFRALPLPQQPDRVKRPQLWLISAAALAAFVLAHVLNGLLTHRTALAVFTNPVFLSLAGMLGAACTVDYLISRSLWPSVALHWVTVVVWILFFGGRERFAGMNLDAGE